MKKKYISPTVEVIELVTPPLLVTSGSGELGAPAAGDAFEGAEDPFGFFDIMFH
jgi:hypothetical protein